MHGSLVENYPEIFKKISSNKNEKIFVITGKNSFFKSGANHYFQFLLKNRKRIVKFYFKKKRYPEISELKNIKKLVEAFNPDLVLAIGGGAVIDYAKIVCSEYSSKNLTSKIKDQSLKLKKKFKLFVIPTTAGSGAEATSNAVIYLDKIKYSFESKNLMPENFFLMPELIVKLNKNIKASSGFDAISQAIESLISTRSTNKSIKFAKKSLNLSIKTFLNYYKNPTLNNSLLMAKAAHFSGKAINITKTTAPHAVSYPLTAHFNVSHGHAVSLTLNEFLKFNYERIGYSHSNFDLKKRYELIFSLTKTKNIYELDKYLAYLKKKVKLEQNFLKLGINLEKKLNLILNGVNLLRLKNNPVKLDKFDLAKVFLDKKYD
tara:strand:+ start:1258 stop:2382 length:1125 start_codon:yes stop_codon:yes gene_type:complete